MRRLTVILLCASAMLPVAHRSLASAADDKPTTAQQPTISKKPVKKPPVVAAEMSPASEVKRKKPRADQPAAPQKKKPTTEKPSVNPTKVGGSKQGATPKTAASRSAPSKPISTGVVSSRAMSNAAVALLINDQIAAALVSAKIPTTPAADDMEFLRRVYLDLHGIVPTADDVRAFLADSSTDKRAKTIDRLLAHRRFATHLADMWDDYLIPATDDARPDRKRFTAWLEEAFASRSWDAIAYDLLTAAGKREENAAVVYLLKGRETLTPAELTDLTSQYFLGVRLNCAQCHDHPFTTLKQADYWGVASFFTEIQYTDRRLQKSGLIRDDAGTAIEKLENAAKLQSPKFLGGEALSADSGESRRAALALWMVSVDNPYFARAMVNRTWSQLFGRGLIEPVDDMHEGNAATHPELLAALSREFSASGFDLRALYRAICNSAPYQRTSISAPDNEQETRLYGRMAVKVLTPEQLYDSLSVVMPAAGPVKNGGPKGDPREEFVQFFRSEGEPNATTYNRGIPQTLRMMNSPQLFGAENEAAAVRRIVGNEASAAEAIERLYFHVLARKPTDDERSTLDGFLAEYRGETHRAYAEILWSLLNGSEFSLNH